MYTKSLTVPVLALLPVAAVVGWEVGVARGFFPRLGGKPTKNQASVDRNMENSKTAQRVVAIKQVFILNSYNISLR